MGGDWYEDASDVRAVSPTGSAAGAGTFSTQADVVMRKDFMHRDLEPRGKRLICSAETPIVIAIDVTGSMGDWSKIMWDKLPMFFGQLRMQGYCPEPAISFAGVGDAPAGDCAPLQVGDFAAGGALDGVISKIWLEGLGGGNQRESYDLVAYYYASDRVLFTGMKPGQKPFFFITGDEGVYDTIDKDAVRTWVDPQANGVIDPGTPTYRVEAALPIDLDTGVRRVWLELENGERLTADLPENARPGHLVQLDVERRTWDTASLFAVLRKRYHVFHIHKAYHSQAEDRIFAQWSRLIGPERILTLENPKAIADIMLGAIAITSQAVTLEEYADDMLQRGQDDSRISEVTNALSRVRPWSVIREEEARGGSEQLPVSATKVTACTGLDVVGPDLQHLILDFKENGAPNSILDLPSTLTDWQKRNLHQFACKSGLASRSVGEGSLRHLTMTQPDIPVRFTDPLTRELMTEPVVGPDGHAYERSTIVAWLRDHNTSPVTGTPLPHKSVSPCESLASEIAAWRVKHGRS